MEWDLLQIAKESEDVASGLHVFLNELPSKATDISGCISELFATSSALRALDQALEYNRFGRSADRIASDADLVLPSLQFTLKEVKFMFSESGRSAYAPGAFPDIPSYRALWDDLGEDMRDDGMSLCVRLETYRSFVQKMYEVLSRGSASDREMDSMRSKIKRLLKRQEPTTSPTSRRRSRVEQEPQRRPHRPIIHTYYSQSSSVPHGIPPPPQSPRPVIHSYYTHYPAPAPPAPEVPTSPTSSSSSGHTYLSGQGYPTTGGGAVQRNHWASYIFDGQHPVSPLYHPGERTICYGRDEPQAVQMLQEDGFQRVLELPFEATDVYVRIYWRPSDHRSRILFLTQERGVRRRFCIPLTALKVLRADSSLQLCRVNRTDGQLELWANLKFTCYERMVLFYSTIVSMKRQDWVKPPQNLEDFFQPWEEQEFGGEIEDDRFLHAFRIFRDLDSGAVRFEASARRGPMMKCPIWTAFVTSYIGSKTWMRRISGTSVQLRELKPYIFCDNYKPHQGTTGKFELKFTSKGDADDFMETFHKIRTR